MKLIELNINAIKELCRAFKVRTLSVFGSILTNRFNDQSDVDFLVDFHPQDGFQQYTDNYFGLYYALKDLLGREVDLVDVRTVKNPYFAEEVNETKRLIYG